MTQPAVSRTPRRFNSRRAAAARPIPVGPPITRLGAPPAGSPTRWRNRIAELQAKSEGAAGSPRSWLTMGAIMKAGIKILFGAVPFVFCQIASQADATNATINFTYSYDGGTQDFFNTDVSNSATGSGSFSVSTSSSLPFNLGNLTGFSFSRTPTQTNVAIGPGGTNDIETTTFNYNQSNLTSFNFNLTGVSPTISFATNYVAGTNAGYNGEEILVSQSLS
jgi:hypothetical protein